MSGYVDAAVKQSNVDVSAPAVSTDDSMHTNYGNKTAQLIPLDKTGPPSASGLLRLQQITGAILYHAWAVNATATNSYGRLGRVSTPTDDVLSRAERLLAHLATQGYAHCCYA